MARDDGGDDLEEGTDDEEGGTDDDSDSSDDDVAAVRPLCEGGFTSDDSESNVEEEEEDEASEDLLPSRYGRARRAPNKLK